MGKQSLASVIRQVAAVVVSVYGVLTASVSALHLPPAVSAVLTAVGPIILVVEHYVGDPSTGTTPAPVTVTKTVTVTPPPTPTPPAV